MKNRFDSNPTAGLSDFIVPTRVAGQIISPEPDNYPIRWRNGRLPQNIDEIRTYRQI